MSKNVAVFVDVANIFYAAKAAGVDIDYVTLLKAATAGRDFVRAYAYTGLDPENENQRQFHSFLSRSGYKVVSKDIRKYGDGRIKANLDIELVVDMMKLSRNLDVAVVISGDGDFAPAIRAVQEMGVRVEVISFRGNTSSDLIDAADVFTDIGAIARVDKDSDRSGRRVAAEGDLSMTEVPNKETEGMARRRRGGRGEYGRDRGDGRSRGVESRDRDRDGVPAVEVAASSAGEPVGLPGNLIVLPGEKLSRAPLVAAVATPTGPDEVDVMIEGVSDELDESTPIAPATGAEIVASDGTGDETAEGRRRRRRRGGRGRGRGRTEGEGEVEVEAVAPVRLDTVAADVPDDDEIEEPEAIRLPSHSTFGSVWDSQLGVPSQSMSQSLTPAADRGEVGEEDDEDEPEIPEYLLAERRQRGRVPNRMGGRMGGRNAGYQAAVDRERYGRSAPPSGGASFGAPRRDDRGGRPAGAGGRQERPTGRGPSGGPGRGTGVPGGAPRQARPERPPLRDERPASREARSPASDGADLDPWSEVPPELEQMLRTELARKIGGAPGRGAAPDRGRAPDPTRGAAPLTEEAADAEEAMADEAMAAHEALSVRTPTADESAPTDPAEPAPSEAAEAATSETSERPRRTRARTGTARSRAGAPPTERSADVEAPTRGAEPGAGAAPTDGPAADAAEPAPGTTRRRSARRTAAAGTAAPTLAGPEDAVTAAAPEATGSSAAGAGDATPEPPERRTRRASGERATAGPHEVAAGAAEPGPGVATGATGDTEGPVADHPAPKRRTTRRLTPTTGDTTGGASSAAAAAPGEDAGDVSEDAPDEAAKPRRRTRRTSETAPSEG